MAKFKLYAVARGAERGIYSTWKQCSARVTGYPNAIFKGCLSLDEAREFLQAHTVTPAAATPSVDLPCIGLCVNDSSSMLTRDTATDGANDRMGGPQAVAAAPPSVGACKRKRVSPPQRVYHDVDNESTCCHPDSATEPIQTAPRRRLTCKAAHAPRSVPDEPMTPRASASLRQTGRKTSSPSRPASSSLLAAGASAQATACHGIHTQEVYVDGACRGNGKSRAKAGYGGYYGTLNDPRNFALPLSAREIQTNNRAEMHAVIRAFRQGFVDAGADPSFAHTTLSSPAHIPSLIARWVLAPLYRLVVYTDSHYVVAGLTQYSKTWLRNGFKLANRNAVQNQDLWQLMFALRDAYNTSFAQQHYLASMPCCPVCDASRTGSSTRASRVVEHEGGAVDKVSTSAPKVYSALNTYNCACEGVELRHVRGHSNIEGNVIADELAVQGALKSDAG